jgi:hypothetical protein
MGRHGDGRNFDVGSGNPSNGFYGNTVTFCPRSVHEYQGCKFEFLRPSWRKRVRHH